MNDQDIEAGYAWSDGSPVTFLNWHPGEPNNANNVENCAEMYPGNGQWNDIRCTDFNGYICKQSLGKAYILSREYIWTESERLLEPYVCYSVLLSMIEISQSAHKREKLNTQHCSMNLNLT